MLAAKLAAPINVVYSKIPLVPDNGYERYGVGPGAVLKILQCPRLVAKSAVLGPLLPLPARGSRRIVLVFTFRRSFTFALSCDVRRGIASRTRMIADVYDEHPHHRWYHGRPADPQFHPIIPSPKTIWSRIKVTLRPIIPSPPTPRSRLWFK
jgi:hypothetical protein